MEILQGRMFLLTRFANKWNFRIIEDKLKVSEDFPKLKYALVGALLECPDIGDFLGERWNGGEYRKTHEARLPLPFEDLLIDVIGVTHTRMSEKISRLTEVEGEYKFFNKHHTDDNRRAAAMRYLFEPTVDVKHFSLDYRPGKDKSTGKDYVGYEFNLAGNPAAGLYLLMCPLLPEIMATDPEALKRLGAINVMFPPENEQIKEALCSDLRAKSLQVIEGKPSQTQSTTQVVPQAHNVR